MNIVRIRGIIANLGLEIQEAGHIDSKGVQTFIDGFNKAIYETGIRQREVRKGVQK